MNDFLIGLVAGVFIGALAVLVISLMVTASRADDALDTFLKVDVTSSTTASQPISDEAQQAMLAAMRKAWAERLEERRKR
jgi:hypothetical protein